MRVILHIVCQGHMAIREWKNAAMAFVTGMARGRKNVVAALYESSIIGCGIIEDNIDTNVFNTWVEKILIADLSDKSVIVMDNAAVHKSKGHIIEFLPPYSSGFNLIENKWAQAKFIRRKLGRNVEEVFESHMPQLFYHNLDI